MKLEHIQKIISAYIIGFCQGKNSWGIYIGPRVYDLLQSSANFYGDTTEENKVGSIVYNSINVQLYIDNEIEKDELIIHLGDGINLNIREILELTEYLI